MPCDQIRSTSIDFSKADPDVLRAALEESGYKIYRQLGNDLWIENERGEIGTYRAGVFKIPETWDFDAIKQQYATQAVKVAAKRFGWNVAKQTGKNKFQLTRRA